jgi:hypothetical protein
MRPVSWHPRIPQITAQLEQVATPYLDRQAIEHLFGIGRTQAKQLLASLPGFTVAKSHVVAREVVLDYLRSLPRRNRRAAQAVDRHARVVETIELARAGRERARLCTFDSELDEVRALVRELVGTSGATVRLPAPALKDLRARQLASRGIHISEGEIRLSIRPGDRADLLVQLAVLLHTVLKDSGEIEKMLSPTVPPPSAEELAAAEDWAEIQRVCGQNASHG